MKIRSLNYPQKFKYDNVNLIITDAVFISSAMIAKPEIFENEEVASPAMTERIEQFIRENPDFSNLLPLNEHFRKRNIDIQLTWTAFNRLTVVVRNFKGVGWQPGRGFRLPNFESWVESVLGKELYGEKPWVIWETPTRWKREGANIWADIDYKKSAWPHGEYVENFNPCNSCGITIHDDTDNRTSCSECGNSIHADGECGPWLDTEDYETAVCVRCYEEATGEEDGGYNRLQSGFNQKVAERITDEDIRQTLTFIEETFNTFEWK